MFVFGQVTRPPCAVRLVGMEIFLLYTRLVDPHVKLYFGVMQAPHCGGFACRRNVRHALVGTHLMRIEALAAFLQGCPLSGPRLRRHPTVGTCAEREGGGGDCARHSI